VKIRLAISAAALAVGVTACFPVQPPTKPGDSKNSPDFRTHDEAQAWFNKYYPYYGDVAKLDSDHDLIACEALP